MLGRETDIGDLVHIAELGHDALTNNLSWNFAFIFGVEFFFDNLSEFDFDIF